MLARKCVLVVAAAAAFGGLLAPTGLADSGKPQDPAAKKADKGSARETQAIGRIVEISPCRTLVEVEVAKAEDKAKATTMRFFGLDPEARESAKDAKKGDTVCVRYVFSPDTQRNLTKKVMKVTVVRGTVVAASRSQLKLDAESGQEVLLGVLENASKDVKALRKGDKVEAYYAASPDGHHPTGAVASVTRR